MNILYQDNNKVSLNCSSIVFCHWKILPEIGQSIPPIHQNVFLGLGTCFYLWSKQGQYALLRRLQSFTHKKLFDLPEIKQSVICQQYQMESYHLFICINHCFFQGSWTTGHLLYLALQSMCGLFPSKTKMVNHSIKFVFSSRGRNWTQMYINQSCILSKWDNS